MNQEFWEDTGQEDNKSAHRKNRTPEKVRFFRFSAEPFIWLLRPCVHRGLHGGPCAPDRLQGEPDWSQERIRKDRTRTSEHSLSRTLKIL